MKFDIFSFDGDHLMGKYVTRSPAPCGVARQAGHGTGERVQLPFPGSFLVFRTYDVIQQALDG
jgi:hypothetical protein